MSPIRNSTAINEALASPSAPHSSQPSVPKVKEKVVDAVKEALLQRSETSQELPQKKRKVKRIIVESDEEDSEKPVRNEPQEISNPKVGEKLPQAKPKVANKTDSDENAEPLQSPLKGVKKKTEVAQADKSPKKNKYRKVDDKIVEKVKKLLPKIKDETITKQAAAEQCGISPPSLASVMEQLKEGLNPAQSKVHQKVTQEIVDVVKDLLIRIDQNKITKQEAVKQSKVSEATFRRIVEQLENDKDPTKYKTKTLTSKETIEKIRKLMPLIDDETMTQKSAAKACEVTLSTFRLIVQKLKNGEDPSQKKTKQKITAEIVEKVRKVFSQVEDNTLKKYEAAKVCGIPVTTFNTIYSKLKNGEDPLQKKIRQKVTSFLVEKIKALLPEIDRGELTVKNAAAQLKMPPETLSQTIAKLRKGIDPLERKETSKTHTKS